jgi:hypothetical protein
VNSLAPVPLSNPLTTARFHILSISDLYISPSRCLSARTVSKKRGKAGYILLATFRLRRTDKSLYRRQWRKDHPFGFYAKPQRNPQGVLDLKIWECGIPGKDKTIWEGGIFKMTMTFPEGEADLTLKDCQNTVANPAFLPYRVSDKATQV